MQLHGNDSRSAAGRWVVGSVILSLLAGWAAATGPAAVAASSSDSGRCTQKDTGGQITVGQAAIAPTMDPGSRNMKGSGGAAVYAAVYDTLMRYDPTSGSIQPWLASGLTHDAAYTHYTLKLRPGVTFGNGDAFDAAAVAAAQNRYMTKGVYSGFASYISSINATDPTTVQYALSTPWTELPLQLSQVFGMIVDQAVVDRLGTGFGSAVNAGAGAGPYELTTFNPPGNVVLKAKTNYWGGPVCIQQITFTTAATAQQGVDSFMTGQYTANLVRDPVELNRWKNSKPRTGSAVQSLVVGAANVYINTTSKSAHLDDVRVRQALQYATDVNAVNQRGFQGTLIAHSSLVPKELGVLKATTGPTFNAAKAKQLLDQVKAETGWDGSMRLLCANSSADFGVALAAVYDNVGFKINLDTTLAITPFVTKVQVQHDYDIACGGLQSYGGDYWDALYTKTFAPTNYGNFHNADWEAVTAGLASAPFGSTAYQTAVNKVQAAQNTLVPQIIVGSFYEATMLQKQLKGVLFTIGDIALFGKAYLAST
jgi:peptide/nickel transport system substrate-binding protein